jgi:ABC-type spermidine/putrescine transport system permease subunit I
MGSDIVFWQWMATALVAVVGYPLAYFAIRSAKKEKQSQKHHNPA